MFNLEYNIKRLNIICQVLFTTNFAHKKKDDLAIAFKLSKKSLTNPQIKKSRLFGSP
jgi:hypothetical protein